jgi:hypothetical protein
MSEDKSKSVITDSGNNEVETSTSVDDARRELLGRLGRFAAYTPPAMLSLMLADKAAAQSGIAPPAPTPTPTSTPAPTAAPTPPPPTTRPPAPTPPP